MAGVFEEGALNLVLDYDYSLCVLDAFNFGRPHNRIHTASVFVNAIVLEEGRRTLPK